MKASAIDSDIEVLAYSRFRQFAVSVLKLSPTRSRTFSRQITILSSQDDNSNPVIIIIYVFLLAYKKLQIHLLIMFRKFHSRNSRLKKPPLPYLSTHPY